MTAAKFDTDLASLAVLQWQQQHAHALWLGNAEVVNGGFHGISLVTPSISRGLSSDLNGSRQRQKRTEELFSMLNSWKQRFLTLAALPNHKYANSGSVFSVIIPVLAGYCRCRNCRRRDGLYVAVCVIDTGRCRSMLRSDSAKSSTATAMSSNPLRLLDRTLFIITNLNPHYSFVQGDHL
jgi:hypothetical protein